MCAVGMKFLQVAIRDRVLYLRAMFGMGLGEILVIGIVALLFIGPQQLPQVARVVGRLFGEIRKATEDLSGGLLEASNEVHEMAEQVTQGVTEGISNSVEEVAQFDPIHGGLDDRTDNRTGDHAEKNTYAQASRQAQDLQAPLEANPIGNSSSGGSVQNRKASSGTTPPKEGQPMSSKGEDR